MSADLQPYPDYKDSGLPWLETIPSGWQVLRAKNVFGLIDIRSESGQEQLLTVSSANGVVQRNSTKVTMFMAASYTGHKLCWPGDLVVNSLWAWGRGLGFSNFHGIVSTAYSVYRPRSAFRPLAQYLNHLVRSDAYHWELQTRSKGVWISRLQLTDPSFFDMPILLPSPEEAAGIVKYLDHAERRIRKYTATKRRLIALLTEQKQAVIHRAVTRGLDPAAPLRPSGIPWLGPKIYRQSQLLRV